MKGIEKGQKKKETPQPLRCGVQKKNNSKWNSLSYLRGDLNPSTTCLTQSQVEVAFVIFTFHILLFISTYIRV